MNPTFKDLLLAHPFNPEKHDVSGWIVSEKLDGVRAYYDGEKLWSRQKKSIEAPQTFLDMLPKGISLDGELFMGRKSFQKLVSTVRKKEPIEEEWSLVEYHVFDIPHCDKPYKQRVELLSVLENNIVKPVKTWEITDNNMLMEQVIDYDKMGAEGLMVRDPESFYKFKRDHSLLKVKTFYDSEAIVLDYTQGTGRLKNLMGALKVVTIGDSKLKLKKDIHFKIGTGFSDDQRINYLNYYPIGSIVTFKFTETTNSGTPRFPVFVKVKDNIE